MTDLQQRLRELSKDKFENFVQAYLDALFPGADIKAVDGAGGDEGIDSFRGNLSHGLEIWQAKHFPDRIRIAQQKQVAKSVAAAMMHKPDRWTLCVPINLRTSEHRWFQEHVVDNYGGSDAIKLLQASDFLKELQHNRELRDAFFPENALSSMMEIRRALTGTESKTTQQLDQLATEYAQQYLAGAMNEDPRLRPILAVGGTVAMRQATPQNGLVFSLNKGENTVYFFARDQKTYNLDPIKFNVRVPMEHQIGIQNAIDRGEGYKLPAGAILNIDTTSPLLESLFNSQELSQMSVEMTPQLIPSIANRVMPLRFAAGSGLSERVLQYVPFKIVRAGQKEIQIDSIAALPLRISVVMKRNLEEGASIDMSPHFLGSDVIRANQIIEFLEELSRSGQLQVYSLDPEATLLHSEPGTAQCNFKIPSSFKNVVSLAAVVSKVFNVPLNLREDLTEEEFMDLLTLSKIATGEDFFDSNWTATWTKTNESAEATLNQLRKSPFAMKVDHHGGWRQFHVFGETIDPGPLSFVADKVVVKDFEEFESAHSSMRVGDQLQIRFQCAGPCRFLRLHSQETLQ